ncbi:kinase-like domain-containing protein [Whalleya microplaca]|nr:kinase-like domain-containing protein [Whalleya microplaca]
MSQSPPSGSPESSQSIRSTGSHKTSDNQMDDYYLSFEERLPKVRRLCIDLWPHADHDTIHIEEHEGGGWNKIFPVTITEDNITQQYILRIPRVFFDIKQTVLILKHLRQTQDEIPVPAVVHFDTTHENSLNYPFVVLRKIPGTSLKNVYSHLTQSQKIIVARKLGELCRKMQSITSPYAGLMKAPADSETSAESSVWIMPFGLKPDSAIPDHKVEDMHDDMLTPETLRKDPPELTAEGILTMAFKRQLFYSTNRDFFWEVEIQEKSLDAIQEMAKDGLLGDNTVCLWHTDLFPRNIMVDVETEPSNPIITGLLDWDEAAYAPRFVASRPLDWLWDLETWGPHAEKHEAEKDNNSEHDAESDGEGEPSTDDEPLEAVQPRTSEELEIKQAFDEAAGEAYALAAYEPRLIIARRLLHHSLHPEWEDAILEKFETVLDHWEDLTDVNDEIDIIPETGGSLDEFLDEPMDTAPELVKEQSPREDRNEKDSVHWIYIFLLAFCFVLLILVSGFLVAFDRNLHSISIGGVQTPLIESPLWVESCNIVIIHIVI